jgi:hypothetical protein
MRSPSCLSGPYRLFNQLVDFYETLCGGDVIVGDLDVITFNPIASTFLKWLRFKFVRWLHYLQHSALLDNELGLFSIVGFPWLQHTPSLVDLTMEIKACT